MVYTVETLEKLNESKLRAEVIIPILQDMGFKNIHESHGGNEIGKDIVYYKFDELGIRKNLAIVAKATKITGQAKYFSGSASEVKTQVEQCFYKRYPDPITGEETQVHEVWVISNKKISTEAVTAIRSSLPPYLRVEFVGLLPLFELVEKHLNNKILSPIQFIENNLGQYTSSFNPTVHITPKSSIISLEDKTGNLKINLTLNSSTKYNNPNIKDELTRFVDYGTAIDFPKELLQFEPMSTFLRGLINLDLSNLESLRFEVEHTQNLPALITFNTDPTPLSFNSSFNIVSNGQKFTNIKCICNNQLSIDIRYNKIEKQVDVSLAPIINTIDVVSAQNNLTFFKSIAGKTFSINDIDGKTLLHTTVSTYNKKVCQLIDDSLAKLVKIQTLTGQKITIPSLGFTDEDRKKLGSIFVAVTEGKLPFRPKTEWIPTISRTREGLNALLNEIDSDNIVKITDITRKETVEITGSTINLGEATFTVFLEILNIDEVRNLLLNNKEAYTFKLITKAKNKSEIMYKSYTKTPSATLPVQENHV